MQQIHKEEEEEDWNGLEWWLLRGELVGLTDVQSSFLFAVTVGNSNTWETYLFDTKLWLRSDNAMATRTSNKNNRFRLEGKTTTLQMYHTFCTFLKRFCTTTKCICLISCFMEAVNKQRRNFISLSELEYSPLEFKSRRVRVHLTKYVRRNNRHKDWKNANSLFKRRSRCRRVVRS